MNNFSAKLEEEEEGGGRETKTDHIRQPVARNYKRFLKIGKVSKNFIKKCQKDSPI